MKEYQPWDDSWRQEIIFVLLSHQVKTPVEMAGDFSYPVFVEAYYRRLKGSEFWKAVAGAMIYVMGHQPDYLHNSSYVYWLNSFEPSIVKDLIYDGVEHVSEDKLETAIWIFQAAVFLDPQIVESHYNLGQAFSQLGFNLIDKQRTVEGKSCLNQAAQYLKNVLEITPGLSVASNNLAYITQYLAMMEKQDKPSGNTADGLFPGGHRKLN